MLGDFLVIQLFCTGRTDEIAVLHVPQSPTRAISNHSEMDVESTSILSQVCSSALLFSAHSVLL